MRNSLREMDRRGLMARKRELEAERSMLHQDLLSDQLNERWRDEVWNDHHSQRDSRRSQQMTDCSVELGIIGQLLGA